MFRDSDQSKVGMEGREDSHTSFKLPVMPSKGMETNPINMSWDPQYEHNSR